MHVGTIEMSSRNVGEEQMFECEIIEEEEQETRQQPMSFLQRQVRNQNKCFLVVMSSALFAAVVYLVVSLYSPRKMVNGYNNAPNGVVHDGFDNAKAQAAFQQSQQHKHGHASHNWWNRNNSSDVSDPTNEATGAPLNPTNKELQYLRYLCQPELTYQEWLNTTISIQDGPKFEIIEQLPHDASAFT